MQGTEIAGKKWVAIADVAEAMKVKRDSLLRYIKKGRLNGQRVGKDQWLISEESLDKFLNQKR